MYINNQAINGLLVFKIPTSVSQHTLREAWDFNTHNEDENRQRETGFKNE